jgi:hypothetical protein
MWRVRWHLHWHQGASPGLSHHRSQVDSIVDATQQQLAALAGGQELPKAEAATLQKRKLIRTE